MTGAQLNTPNGNRRLIILSFAAIALVALALRLWAPGPTTETYDENLWLHRSGGFATAIADGHFSQATADDRDLHLTNPTMPGVTTMWAGVAGRQLARASGALGFSTPVSGPSQHSPQVLRAAQSVVSVVCAALLVLLMVLVKRCFDTRTALLAGGVLAVEPWLVALSHVLHTDALVTMFSITSLLALYWALHGERAAVQGPAPPPRTKWIIAAAGLAAGALLTKTNAIGIVAPGMAFIAWDAWRHRYRERIGDLRNAALIGLGTMVAVSLIAWPALLADPIHQFALMFDASKQVGKLRGRFFHGSIQGFIPWFYAVALVFRLTPWMLVWCAIGIAGGITDFVQRIRKRISDRPGPRIPSWVLLTPLPYFTVISLSRFGYDRYAVALVPFGAIAGACVIARWTRRVDFMAARSPRVLAACGLVFVCIAAIVPVRQAPYGLGYVNPLVGGQKTAVRWIPVESGQVSARLNDDLMNRVGGDCTDMKIASAYPHPAVDRCGMYFSPTDDWDLASGDYAMTFQVGAQRPPREWFRPWLREHAHVVSRVEIDGVTFGELWKLPPSP